MPFGIFGTSVLVLNVGGYVGSSTLSEIDYALDIAGKSVKFLHKGQEWGTVLPGTIVPGSGTVVAVERSTPDSPLCYVTFDREGHPGSIPPGAPAWKEGCNVWSDARNSSDSVPVGMSRPHRCPSPSGHRHGACPVTAPPDRGWEIHEPDDGLRIQATPATNVRTIAAMVLSRRGLPVVVTNERLAEAGNHMVEIQYLAGCRHVKTRPLGMRA